MQAINKTELEANWSLISSDPDVFNDMLRAYDINQIVIQEAYSVSFDDLINDSPVYGVIYTSRYDDDEPLPDNIEEEEPGSENIVFTSQIVTNACATLALLSILLNTDIDRGQIIDDFASFTNDFSPVNRGIALGNSPHIRKIHNSYAIGETRANASIQADTLLTEDDLVDEDSFHFVSYIPKDGHIWELDGLKIRPVKLAAIKEGEHWLKTLGPILGQKMSDNDQCNILVAVKNPLIDMKKCLANYTGELELLNNDQNEESASVQMELNDEEKESQKRKRNEQEEDELTLKKQRQSSDNKDQLQQSISILSQDIKEREAQTQKDMLNMSRLKFDYFPFITQLITKVHQYQMKNQLPPPSTEETNNSKTTTTKRKRKRTRTRAPKASNTPKAPQPSKAPEAPKVPEPSKAPETPIYPKVPEPSKAPETPTTPELSNTPEAPETLEPLKASKTPKAPKAPRRPIRPIRPMIPMRPIRPRATKASNTTQGPKDLKEPNDPEEANEAKDPIDPKDSEAQQISNALSDPEAPKDPESPKATKVQNPQSPKATKAQSPKSPKALRPRRISKTRSQTQNQNQNQEEEEEQEQEEQDIELIL